MPVSIISASEVPRDFPFKCWSCEHEYDLETVEVCLKHLYDNQGLPEARVNLVLAVCQVMGLEFQKKIWIFANCGTEEALHRVITHEYGHWVEKHVLGGNLDSYFELRGGKIYPTSEVFAEDFRFLFGDELARRFHHVYWPQASEPTGERRERLKAYIMDAVKTYTEAPSNEKAGASKFGDTKGHWAEAAILKVSEAGLMNGYPDGTFGPDKPITRGEVAAILARLIERGIQNG